MEIPDTTGRLIALFFSKTMDNTPHAEKDNAKVYLSPVFEPLKRSRAPSQRVWYGRTNSALNRRSASLNGVDSLFFSGLFRLQLVVAFLHRAGSFCPSFLVASGCGLGNR